MEEEEIKEGYTRVSQILSQWDKFSFIDPTVLERKRLIGINVHAGIDSHNKGIPAYMSDDEGGQYFKSFLLYQRKERLAIINSEFRMYDDELMITGKIDGLLSYPGYDQDKHILVDWKTSSTRDDLMWEMQANFYMYLLKMNGVDHVSDICRFVKLDKDGGLPKVYEYEYSPKIMESCFASVVTYHRVKPWLEKRKFVTDENLF